MTTSELKGRFFLLNESIRIDSHNELNRIDSNRELECSTLERYSVSNLEHQRHSKSQISMRIRKLLIHFSYSDSS